MRSAAQRTGVLLLGVVAAGMLPSAPAGAQESGAESERASTSVAALDATGEPRFELALSGGRRVGGLLRVDTGDEIPLDIADAGALGGRVGWRLRGRLGRRMTLQAEYSRQETSLRRQRPGLESLPVAAVAIEYLHLGARLRLAQGAVQPYLSGGLGPMRLRSRETGDADVYPSLSWGTGLLLPVASRVALTSDLRFFASLLGGNATVPCRRPASVCQRTGDETVLLQIQLFGGIAVQL